VLTPDTNHASRLFRHTDPTLPVLFMYRNKESVIIGRNQVWMQFHSESESHKLDRTHGKKSTKLHFAKLGSTLYAGEAEEEPFITYALPSACVSRLNARAM
jgi:hypothetical protein